MMAGKGQLFVEAAQEMVEKIKELGPNPAK
jgi:coenzyme F420-reducing hydrogenase delta subunit